MNEIQSDCGAYLSKCYLYPSQVVIIAEVDALVVDVVDPQLQILHRFKVIIHSETLTKGRTGGIHDTLSTTQLMERQKREYDLLFYLTQTVK